MLDSQQERRRMQRWALDVPVAGTLLETEVIVTNASPNGFLLQVDREIPLGSRIEVAFVFPPSLDSRGIRVVFRCKVVRLERGVSKKRFGLAAVVLRSESEPVGRCAAA